MQNNTKNMVTIGIHQPEFLPWLGFFKKMQQCDTFVLFDDVQFDRHGFQNRNQIRNKKEPFFLTIPVKSHRISKINEVKMDNSQNWREKHLKTITTNYSKSKFFEEYFKELENIYNEKID